MSLLDKLGKKNTLNVQQGFEKLLDAPRKLGAEIDPSVGLIEKPYERPKRSLMEKLKSGALFASDKQMKSIEALPREQQLILGFQKPTEQERKEMNIKAAGTKQGVVAQNFFEGASLGLSNLAFDKDVREAQRQAESENIGLSVASEIAGSLLPQGMIYKGLKSVFGAGKAGVSFLTKQGTDLLIDTIVQAPIETIEAIQKDKSIPQIAKDFAVNRAIDVATNLFFVGTDIAGTKLKEVLQSKYGRNIAKEKGIDVDTIINAIENGDKETVQKAMSDFYVNPSGVADTKPFEQLQLPAPKEGLDDFTKWRKENFGGAYGKLSEADDIAMKQLYKEDTRIDLLPRQREVPRTVLPSDVQPRKLSEILASKEVTETSKVEAPAVTNPQLKTIEAQHKENIEIIMNKNITDEMRNKELKAEGMKYSAEKRKIIQGDSFEPVEGGLTPKELADKIAKENTMYIGKKVLTPSGEGTVEKVSFGKVVVNLDNGTKQTFDRDSITSKFTPTISPKSEAPITQLPKIETPIEPAKIETRLETPIVGESPAKFIDTAIKSDVTGSELREKLKTLNLGTTSNEARLQMADDIVKENFEGALNLVKSGDKFTNDLEGAIGFKLYDQLQQQGRYDDAFEVAESLARKGRKAGQEIQMLSVWSKTTPEGMQKWAQKTLSEANVEIKPEVIKQVGDDMRLINQMTPEELAEKLTNQIKNKREKDLVNNFLKGEEFQRLKDLNVAMTMKKVTDELPVATARKLSTVQAMAHLLNGKTFMRNILGNVASIGLENISKIPASGLDRMLSLFTKNRTVVASMPQWQQTYRNALKEGKRSVAEVLLGVNRVSQDKYDLFFESAFKGVGDTKVGKALAKVGQGAEKAMGLSLTSTDEFFKGFVKADSLYNQLEARLGKEVKKMSFDEILNKATKEEIETAVNEAKYATFQNDSLPAQFLSKAKQVLNLVGFGGKGGKGNEFGLGDLTIKYTRVPGNIIARGIEYSPLGYGKMLQYAGDLTNPANQRQFSQIFGRATTGTGIIGMGYLLGKAGLITSEGETSYDKAAWEHSEGKGNYKLNVTGLKRLLAGGDPTLKEGDKLTTYSWLDPVSVPLAVGATLSSMDGVEKTPEEIWKAMNSTTMSEAIDLPTLYTIKSMVYESQKPDSTPMDIIAVPFNQSASGFVPAIVRQTAQYIDPVIRETKGASEQETAKNKILANIPFASQGLEPKLTPLGKEQEREQNLLSAFLSPTTTTTYKPEKLSENLSKVEQLTGETSQYPARTAPKTIKDNNKNALTLTAKEKSLWQKEFGASIEKAYTEIFRRNKLNERTANDVLNLLEKAEKEAREVARKAILKERGVK